MLDMVTQELERTAASAARGERERAPTRRHDGADDRGALNLADAVVGTRRGVEADGAPIEVAPGVAYLKFMMVNVLFIGERAAGDRGWVLVDAGLPGSAAKIAHAAAQRYGADARPAAIVLTHGHFDHVGALRTLAERWDVPIYAHRLEMPYLTGRSKYPPMDPTVGGGGMAFLSPLYPRGPEHFGRRLQPLPEDGSVPFAPGWRWVHTPGHTHGHVAFVRDADRTVVAGDAVITTKQESTTAVIEQRPEIHAPPAYATTDWQHARESVRRIAEMEPEVLATGHGIPLRGEAMRAELHALVEHFGSRGIPAQGRYVWQPAIADERGVISVPPAVPNPTLRLAVGLGIALIAGLTLAALLRRDDDLEPALA